MIEEEEEFKDICVTLILDFCREILDDQIEIDDVTISQVGEFCQDWIDENFGKDQTIIEENPCLLGGLTSFDTNMSQHEPDAKMSQPEIEEIKIHKTITDMMVDQE